VYIVTFSTDKRQALAIEQTTRVYAPRAHTRARARARKYSAKHRLNLHKLNNQIAPGITLIILLAANHPGRNRRRVILRARVRLRATRIV